MVRVEFQIKHNNHQIVITSGHIIPFICILCNWTELPTYSEGRVQLWNTEKTCILFSGDLWAIPELIVS